LSSLSEDTDKVEVIILLGESFNEKGKPSKLQRNLLKVASSLHAAHPNHQIITSGGDRVGVGVSEAQIMRDLLVWEDNIPSDNII
jgi:uncharacterized SAM-binding protein YcdF (DUF218 family)